MVAVLFCDIICYYDYDYVVITTRLVPVYIKACSIDYYYYLLL